MKFVTLKKCPLCGSSEIIDFKHGTINVKKIDSDNFKITDSSYGSLWDFSRCKKCSFVFSNPKLDKESLIEFYSALEDTEYSEEKDGRAKNFKTVLNRIKKLQPADNSLLDIGSASGIFVKLAKEKGYNADGIEPSGFLVKEAKEKFGIDLFRGTVEEFKNKHRYSVITLLDIIEHVHSPENFISQVSELLNDKGLLVIVTPDIDSFTSKITGSRWWHYRIAHINFFNKKSLEYLLKKNGLEIVEVKRYAWNFSLFYLLSRLFPMLKKKKSLQNVLKRINLKVQLFDSLEIYARKI